MKKSVITLGAVALVSSAVGLANNHQAEAASYKVQTGDTLSKIASEYKTSVENLKAENNLTSHVIFEGQELSINELAVEKDQVKVHTVKANDTVSKIADTYDITVDEIVDWNDLKSADLIFVGQELKISQPKVEENKESASTEETVSSTEPVVQEESYEEPVQNNDISYEENYEKSYQENSPEESSKQEASAPAKSNNDGMNWSGLAACESGGHASAVDPSGTYHGLYQFDAQTWQSVGGSGVASNASAEEQTMRAQKLYEQRGSSPWPVCGSNL